jgi:hypothetical protein
MSMTDFPAMLVSESAGWTDIDRAHRTRAWYRWVFVIPMSFVPAILYVYSVSAHPGAVFPLTVPAATPMELLATAGAFYIAQVAIVTYLAMLIRRMTLARDHDPGDDGPYALATIALLPFWIASLSLAVPSQGLVIAAFILAGIASVVLLRHGARPLLHIADERVAHYIADVATMSGLAAWIVMVLLSAFVLSVLLVRWTFAF